MPHSWPNQVSLSLSLLNNPRFQAGNYGSRVKNEQHMFGATSVCLISTALVRYVNEQKCCVHMWWLRRFTQAHDKWLCKVNTYELILFTYGGVVTSHHTTLQIFNSPLCHLLLWTIIYIFISGILDVSIFCCASRDYILESFENKSRALMVEFWQTVETDEYAA